MTTAVNARTRWHRHDDSLVLMARIAALLAFLICGASMASEPHPVFSDRVVREVTRLQAEHQALSEEFGEAFRADNPPDELIARQQRARIGPEWRSRFLAHFSDYPPLHDRMISEMLVFGRTNALTELCLPRARSLRDERPPVESMIAEMHALNPKGDPEAEAELMFGVGMTGLRDFATGGVVRVLAGSLDCAMEARQVSQRTRAPDPMKEQTRDDMEAFRAALHEAMVEGDMERYQALLRERAEAAGSRP